MEALKRAYSIRDRVGQRRVCLAVEGVVRSITTRANQVADLMLCSTVGHSHSR